MKPKEQRLNDFRRKDADPYTHAVLRKLGVDTLNSFTEEQRRKLIESLSACQSRQKHSVDIRGVVSLFFVRFYFVIFVGRDTRKKTKMLEGYRRHQSGAVGSFFATVLFICYLLITLLIIFFIVAYLLKSAMGINIFPDRHLLDFLTAGE